MDLNYNIEDIVDFGLFMAELDYSDWPARTVVTAMHVMALEANPN